MNLVSIAREFKEVPIGLIDDPELPSRTSMDDTAMDELVANIRAIGMQQPMIVARVGDRFEVIAGHRRRLACLRAGLAAAPCIIYPSKDGAHVAIQYAENRFREELNPADEAILFAELLERDCGGDVDTLCARLGEKRPYVENRLLLLRDADVFEALRANQLTKVGIALQLLRVTDPTMRRYYLDAAIRGGATVAVVSGWVTDWQQSIRSRQTDPSEPVQASAPAPVPLTNYFTCCVCGGTHNVHTMQPVNVHGDCKTAILDRLLASYRGEA